MKTNPEGLQLGKNVVIEEGVMIGDHVTIGHNTVILKGTIIGDHVTIGSNCVLGIKPSGNKRMRRDFENIEKLTLAAIRVLGILFRFIAAVLYRKIVLSVTMQVLERKYQLVKILL